MNRLRQLIGREHPPRVGVVAAELAGRRRPRYLEIGIETGVVFLHVRAARKLGIDPAPRVPRWKWFLHPNALVRGSLFRTTSDRFFDGLDAAVTFDVILVDGDHSYAQSLRDVEHALDHLAEGGVILIHDANPPTAAAASPDPGQSGRGPWCGEPWKTIVHLRATRPDLNVTTLDADFGIGVVKRGEPDRTVPDPVPVERLSYADLERDRKGLLGLRAV